MSSYDFFNAPVFFIYFFYWLAFWLIRSDWSCLCILTGESVDATVIHTNRLLFTELRIDLRLICAVALIFVSNSRNEENACWFYSFLCYFGSFYAGIWLVTCVDAVSVCCFAGIVFWMCTLDMEFVSRWCMCDCCF